MRVNSGCVAPGVRIAPDTPEFAINASNRRHWHGPVRLYIDECLAGTSGDGGADFDMRWIGSLVAESLRIVVRGGVFLYPADARPGYREGRLRLLYEARPMALVMEWAGGPRPPAAAASSNSGANTAPARAVDHRFGARRPRRHRRSRRNRADVRQ